MRSKGVVLKSIEVAGFKSFAKRTRIEFGTGLIAIVGPNGSGKSNIADAVKWVFGEQSTKRLRSDKSEDLIYHGGDGKARSSMAEVVITLDGSSAKMPLGLSEVEITRRLYRDGESNYLLNGKNISLSKLQEILSKIGFGVGSYTVIGQGMVERLILSSGVERKRLFEEASGIKPYEIKLAQTNNKFLATQHNLLQIEQLIAELKPQHESLTKQAGLLQKRIELLEQIGSFKLAYIGAYEKGIKLELSEKENSARQINMEIDKLGSELKALELSKSSLDRTKPNLSASNLDKKLDLLESKRLVLEQSLGETRLRLQAVQSEDDPRSELNRIEADKKQCDDSLLEHNTKQATLQQKIYAINDKISSVDSKIKLQTKELDKTNNLLKGSQKTEYLRHCLGLLDILQDGMRKNRPTTDINIIFYKMRRMLKHSINDNSAELALKVGKIQNSISSLLAEREGLTEQQTAEIIKQRAIELDTAFLQKKLKNLLNLQERLSAKLGKSSDKIIKLQNKIIELEKNIAEVSGEIDIHRRRLVEIAANNESDHADGYYKEHEELSGKLILKNQELELCQASIAQLKVKLKGSEALYHQWFPKGTNGIKPHKGVVELTDIDTLNAQLAVLEEINPKVEDSAKEASERMDFLEGQRNDLLSSLEDLRNLSTKTEERIKKVFEQGFEKINKNFGGSFTRLFGGGKAELKLSRQEQDYGIDIVVQLPNKKQQKLSSLSGGEKALASMALLSAILSSNPSPFVVLDEVDAALDESNTKKFAGTIKEITKHSQVLVITHNHETMSVADELIGVTTSGNNDSHILKARLDNLPSFSPTQ